MFREAAVGGAQVVTRCRPTDGTSVSGEGRVRVLGYDPAGQLMSVTQLAEIGDPVSEITVGLAVERAGAPPGPVIGNGNATIYTWTPWGLPASVIEPSTTAHPSLADRTWTTGYDAAGQPVRYQLPGGGTRDLAYDGLGNLVEEIGTGAEAATATRQLGYDPLGRVTSVSVPGGATTYAWDDRGLLTGSAGPAGTASFVYDGDGRLTTRTDAAGTATFTTRWVRSTRLPTR
jgi:YD repeat-containing protein